MDFKFQFPFKDFIDFIGDLLDFVDFKFQFPFKDFIDFTSDLLIKTWEWEAR